MMFRVFLPHSAPQTIGANQCPHSRVIGHGMYVAWNPNELLLCVFHSFLACRPFETIATSLFRRIFSFLIPFLETLHAD
ncbi:hypothetical protein Fuma_00467 [Fuerstiella marisgermanici]|uniref:Uncharacterized protein n=1 Tax=Fuerstiella marisgermanici TaxID=1891926 RepID=A0A1P8W9Z1_9PLAN|nr:hypothetical protein Fuma_00467 [Fuerstiella marisgermanici]